MRAFAQAYTAVFVNWGLKLFKEYLWQQISPLGISEISTRFQTRLMGSQHNWCSGLFRSGSLYLAFMTNCTQFFSVALNYEVSFSLSLKKKTTTTTTKNNEILIWWLLRSQWDFLLIVDARNRRKTLTL